MITRQFSVVVLLLAVLTVSGCTREPPPPDSMEPPRGAGIGRGPMQEPFFDVLTQPMLPTAEDRNIGGGQIHFSSMLSGSGITFRHTSGDSPEKAFPASNGSGVAAIDVDLDGLADLYFGNGTVFPIDPTTSRSADELYRNLGDWQFRNITNVSGLGDRGYTAGLATGDFDNDGFTDLYAAAVGPNHLYMNMGDGTFADISQETLTYDSQWATGAVFVDFDHDGDADLYVCNYAQWTLETNRFCGDQARGIRMYCSPTLFPPADDVLYVNEGDGRFSSQPLHPGVNDPPGRAQGIICADLNSDHRIDLYVSNDINPNALLIGGDSGRLTNVAENSGIAYDHLGRSQASMGLAVGDTDRNGLFDVFVTNYEKEHNALYENRGDGQFLELGVTRIPEGSLPHVGWGTALQDFDLDGWCDLIVTNGHTDNNLHQLGKEGEFMQPPGLWKNDGGHFTLVGRDGGEYFRGRYCGRGLLTSDLDNDGDVDVVIGHQDDFPALLRNDCLRESRQKSLQLRLVGHGSLRDATGTVVEVIGVQPPMLHTVCAGGSYMSASDLRLVLTAGDADEIRVRIRWPNAMQTEVGPLKVMTSYVIIQPEDAAQSARVHSLPDSKTQ